jgi:hypothetical protein
MPQTSSKKGRFTVIQVKTPSAISPAQRKAIEIASDTNSDVGRKTIPKPKSKPNKTRLSKVTF